MSEAQLSILNYALLALIYTIASFAQVVVGARVSKSGNATPQSGDLVGQSQPVANTAQGLRIVIDKVQP